MNGYSTITQHCLYSCCSHLDETSWVVLQLIFEVKDNSELDLLLVARNLEKSSLLQINVLYFNVGYSCF